MEISNNSLNQPVSFYTKNTGNTINMAIDEDKRIYSSNSILSEISYKEKIKTELNPKNKKRRSKRLNTMDTDYLPDETTEEKETPQENNFFIDEKGNKYKQNIKKALENFAESAPLINYFFLKNKKQKIQKTIEKLNNINQNVDELMNTTVPYGEEGEVYKNIAKNLTDAVTEIGNAKRNLNIY